MKTEYDLLIVGGGMVGASLACALLPLARRYQLSIALVEAMPLPDAGSSVYQPSYDARSTALAYGARTFYEQLGIWAELSRHLTAIDRIHVSDKGQFGATRLNAEQEQVEALGYVVENRWLGQVLLQHIREQGSDLIDFICPAEVVDMQPCETGYEVELSAPESQRIGARLVVMADGGRSALRNRMGIGYTEQPYGQYAIVANLSLDRPHRNIAYERFTATGPIALLPGESVAGEHRCALVWTLPDDELAAVTELSDGAFLKQLQEHFGYRAGRFIRVGARHHYPLKLVQAEEQVRRGLVVLGNAAHALHPIAGQGYNLALRGVVGLAEMIAMQSEQGGALGDLAALQAYEQKRRKDQFRTIEFSDRTMKLFTSQNSLLRLGRTAGLQFMDICPSAKTLFARAAMGLDMPAMRLP
ncbi:2-octaprenyl-6-methoxyphenyl hydroxylase [Nitrincola alkalilacustris]|uniref:2-octaprenyl-6-methoxyphenyl hydroxylase n=1 Tax=Nitrincola alkalilacustris TaxID=1571224 RepID=UPI00124C515E|nr:2-octaprenyl-6-methoxyphenyl hydroxylase [Nitrincola alkalilacustris]